MLILCLISIIFFFSSHYNGFLRFLNFLTKFDWQNEPLIVNLNDQLTSMIFLVFFFAPVANFIYTQLLHLCYDVSFAFLYSYISLIPVFHHSAKLLFLPGFLKSINWITLFYLCLVEDVGEIQERFGATRSQLPPAVIATPYDKEMSVWTKINPSKQVENIFRICRRFCRIIIKM